MAINSERLRYQLELVLHVLFGPTQTLLERPEFYPPFMARLCCLSQTFVPLLEEALARARASSDTDGVAKLLVPYLEKHIADESGEDMMADLEVLGWTRSEILHDMSKPSIAALVGSQLYWARHCHPVAVLGYIQLLEGYPPSRELVEDLISRSGLPPAAFHSLLEHAELDIDHRDELHELLDALPLDGEQQALITSSALRTVSLLHDAFEDIFEPATEREDTPVANV